MTQQITEGLAKLNAMISSAADGPTAASPPVAASSATDISSVRQELAQLFTKAISSAFPTVTEPAAVTACNNPKFGDYQCNSAMGLYAKIKGQEGAPKNPRAVAEAIVAHLPESPLIAGEDRPFNLSALVDFH